MVGGYAMSPTIVLGNNEFLGFHICHYLLNQGEDVIGLKWMEARHETEEEREYLFGRNANYVEVKTIEDIPLEEQSLVCINLYDTVNRLIEEKEELKQFFDYVKNQRVLFFLPLTCSDDIQKELDQWKEHVGEWESVQWIYVSYLYGPWLDKNAELQRLLAQEKGIALDLSRAIFIEDFLGKWNDLLQLTDKCLIIQGEMQRDWQEQCASFFCKIENRTIEMEETEEAQVMIIKATINLKEGIQVLQAHNEKLVFLDQWKEK